jgi:hypothetical protein
MREMLLCGGEVSIMLFYTLSFTKKIRSSYNYTGVLFNSSDLPRTKSLGQDKLLRSFTHFSFSRMHAVCWCYPVRSLFFKNKGKNLNKIEKF